ncbi:MAG: phosphatase PAP2 family protein [Oscillospiraceae bacterium]|nr:phosphatase PAP2 family protein [Oscillospiraceae bacterium]
MRRSDVYIAPSGFFVKAWLPGTIGVVAMTLFLLVTIQVLNGSLDGWNAAIYARVAARMHPALTRFLMFVSFFGQWFVSLFVAGFLVVIPWTRRQVGVPVLLATFLGMGFGYILKRVIAIPRPSEVLVLLEASGYGHPSGHTMRTTVFFGMCVILIWRYTDRASVRIGALALAVGLSGLMGFSRIYLGAHTATDTVAAYLAGIAVLAFCALCLIWKPAILKRG